MTLYSGEGSPEARLGLLTHLRPQRPTPSVCKWVCTPMCECSPFQLDCWPARSGKPSVSNPTPSPPPLCGVKDMRCHPSFRMGLGIQTQASCLHSKCFTFSLSPQETFYILFGKHDYHDNSNIVSKHVALLSLNLEERWGAKWGERERERSNKCLGKTDLLAQMFISNFQRPLLTLEHASTKVTGKSHSQSTDEGGGKLCCCCCCNFYPSDRWHLHPPHT